MVSRQVKRSKQARTTAFYNIWGSLYTRFRDFSGDSAGDKTALLSLLEPFAKDKVLDVGTGPGVYALRIAAKYPDSMVTGIDVSPYFIAAAAGRAAEAKAVNVEFLVGDIEDLVFGEASFSKVICAGVLSIIGDRAAAVSEMRRVLKPGGKLAVREPLRSNGFTNRVLRSLPNGSYIRKKGEALGLMFGHFSPEFMSEEELRNLFLGGGFSTVEYRGIDNDLLVVAVK